MLKPNSTVKIDNTVPDDFLRKYPGIFIKYFDRVLLDEKISDIGAVILSTHIIEFKQGKSGARYEDVKDVYVALGRREENFRKALHQAKKQKLIEVRQDRNGKNKMIFLTPKGIKYLWDLLGKIEKAKVYIIKAGEHFRGFKLFENILEDEISQTSEVLICDPYVSHKTLYPFSSLKGGGTNKIRILTSIIEDRDKFLEYLNRFRKETGISIEVKKLPHTLHDRFLIVPEKKLCLSIGTSIKDLGNKDTIIQDVSPVFRSLLDLFEERWKKAEEI